jgi:NAD(P)-dependent dehydrogenase (short-subunit alcohol dehydrogenase family)
MLKGKTALVTGSTSGIGLGIAKALASQGANIVLNGFGDVDGPKSQVQAFGVKVAYHGADMSKPADIEDMMKFAASTFGRVDILVNNAGIYPSSTTPTTDEETFDLVYDVNVKAPFFLTQALVPGMISAGGGVIVNLSSWIARLGIPVSSLYSSTKGATETLTRAWAAEFGPQGVRVNAISPGVIVSPDWDTTAEHPGEVMMRGTPAGRSGHPDAIAAAAVYLASDESAFVHGIVLDVDGGRTGVAVVAA